MSILAQSETRGSARRKLEEIALVLRAVRSVSRRCLELTIQGLLNRWVTAGLAGDPLEPAPWCCPRCETDKRSAFRRNGSYTRRLQSLAGLVVLQVPRLRCRCGAHIPLRFPVLEPRRRHWWDVWVTVIEGIGERVSCWHVCDRLGRRGVHLSRSTIVRWLARLRLPPLGAIPGTTDEIQADGLYGHLWGPLPHRWRNHTYALVIAANRDPRCPEKVLGAVLAAEEDQEAYRSLGDLLLSRGLEPEGSLTVLGDGAPAIKAGLGLSFPKAQFLRCLWHLSRLVADLGPPEARLALRRDCRRVLRAPTWDEALARYSAFRRNWLERAPESCRALAEGFEDAMLPLLPDGPQVRQRTNGLAERIAREFRRFLRPREALRSAATAPALVALALAQVNARHRREDWLVAFLGAAVGLPQRLTQFRIPLHT
jgi:transposase-like protein